MDPRDLFSTLSLRNFVPTLQLWGKKFAAVARRRNRVPHTTRANKHTAAYRAARKARNKQARWSRKINRQRGH